MTEGYSAEDVVTVIRLVSLGSSGQGDANAGIVTTVGQASMRAEGESVFLVTRNASALRRLEVGDIVHWVAERFGVVWLAEQRAHDVRVAESGQ
jgi:hypothetical protein